jgi:serine phosphatase RsbU (regulator of sigma subunit)
VLKTLIPRPWYRDQGVWAGAGCIGILSVINLANPAGPQYSIVAGFAVAPLLAGILVERATRILWVGAAALVLAWYCGVRNELPVTDPVQEVRLGLVAISGVAAYLAARVRLRQRAELLTMGEVAKAAQKAIMTTTAPNPEGMQAELRYFAATEAALIGGDAYECAETPFGLRLLVADARGKGMEAVRTASLALGAFREWAHLEPDLGTVLARMDDSMARELHDSDFVTALAAEIDGARLRFSLAGHPPPFLVRRGQVEALARPSWPPLSLFHELGQPPVHEHHLDEGDTLLLYTDGLVEARDDAGRFFPVEQHLARLSSAHPDDLPAVVDGLVDALRDHVDGRLGDDLVLVAIQLRSRTQAADGAKTVSAQVEASTPEPSAGELQPTTETSLSIPDRSSSRRTQA